MSVHPPARQAAPRKAHRTERLPAPRVPLPRAVAHAQSTPTWGWALVEIRADGTWGEPRVIPAPGTLDPPPTDDRPHPPSSIAELSELLKPHLAAARLEDADRGDVVAVLSQGADAAPADTRSRFLGPLAHVEAIQGDLRRAERHAGQVRSGPPDPNSDSGQAHALLAQAWVALERADFPAARLHLDTLDDVVRGPVDRTPGWRRATSCSMRSWRSPSGRPRPRSVSWHRGSRLPRPRTGSPSC
jgi:hypothetical protein